MCSPVCPNCGGNSKPFLRARDYNRRIEHRVFSYYRCRTCQLVFLDPVPADLASYYPDDYYGLADTRDELARRAEPERYKLELVARFKPGGTLIEIGPGGGGFAHLANEAGFKVRVIEMNADSCSMLENALGIDATCTGDEAEALWSGRPADVVALWHVFEHLDDPFELVRAAAQSLNPGGILVLAAPNPAAVQFRILGRRWVHLDAPRHTRLIPQDVVRSVAEQSGLRLALQTTMDEGSIGWNKFGWQYSFANLFQDPKVRDLAMRAGALVTRAMRPIEEREGRGSAYTMVFERPR
jgi:2-polyprenyl-3-methyl-5-hydroxy-6-metoxy-1,4-benzoquinol methylase